MPKRMTAPAIAALKGLRKITMLTATDYPTAKLVDQSGMDMVLVGDSLAMVALGREDTLALTLDEMLHHCRAVCAGVQNALVVGDMPFMSYEASVEQAVRNAGRMLQEGGVRAVKVEGAAALPQIKAMIAAGIPVMGHVGLTPQRVAVLGGFTVQGKTTAAAQLCLNDARSLAAAGCFSIVLETIPAALAARITAAVAAPTIGIGAGPDCDGQVLVFHDLVGLFDRFVPKFVKQYAQLSGPIAAALAAYRQEVTSGCFPGPEHSFAIDPAELESIE